MLYFRTVRTKGNARSVQVYTYRKSKRVIIKHIGSGTTDQEIMALEDMASVSILDYTRQASLFEDTKPTQEAVLMSQCEYLGIYYAYFYDTLSAVQYRLGYALEVDTLLNDLIVMRISEPASKLRSIELMETCFGIKHRRQRFYGLINGWI
jgi:hypothetical protein